MKIAILIAAALGTFCFFFFQSPMAQDLSYHLFVDHRLFWNIPNAMDVLSNFAFLIVGILGISESIKLPNPQKKIWLAFFMSILFVAPGSAYYHYAPSNETLIWDRLPMSTGFMALYIALLTDHISEKWSRYLPWALLLGILSVIVWVVTDDLRFYFWVQFSSFFTIPLILILFPSRFTHKSWYGFTLGFYLLAKWTEIKDKEIFYWSHEFISGHSLKHLFAAAGLMGIWWMIKVRTESETASSPAVSNSALR